MLIGIIGDIHGNIDALEAMYARLESMGVERVMCTGDIVGYGGAPGECIDFMRSRKVACVCGNHDSYTVYPELERDGIREDALEVFRWNREVLSKEQLDWLAKLPMSIDTKSYTIRHASCLPFPSWDYVLGDRSVALHFLYQDHTLCFNGHSHVPLLAMHSPGRRPAFSILRNVMLPRGMNVMIGVGSVGQPRDGDPRACAAVYDTSLNRVSVIRTPYDIKKAQARILDAKLPEFLAYRLAEGR